MNGVILTYVDNLDVLDDCVRRGGYDTVKIVTSWGLGRSWTAQDIRRVCQMVPHVVVRTVSGDPSYQKPSKDFWYVDENRTFAEVAPWYRVKDDILIELGNEPNVAPMNTREQHEWAYFLGRSVVRCRTQFTGAKLISPAMLFDAPKDRPLGESLLRIGRNVIALCDYIGLHAYEFWGWERGYPAYTGGYEHSVQLLDQLFPQKPWFLSEYGINDPKTPSAVKGERYSRFVRNLDPRIEGTCYYHLNVKGDIHPEYHMYPSGDVAFHRGTFR